MTLDEFKNTLQDTTPPEGLSVFLLSLWHDGKGNWDKAHSLVDSLFGEDASHVHAYLHRKEGDLANADYWYRRAGKERPNMDVEKEWDSLVGIYLQNF
jgi:hypothetical protein